MSTITLSTYIEAPIERCFDLARSVEVHQESTASTREEAIAGRLSGLCEAGDTITWRATHLGIRQKLTVRITRMERPHFFEDEMLHGAFAMMRHKHFFRPEGRGTIMEDEFVFAAPLGVLGRLAEGLFLTRYMRGFLLRRNDTIKTLAEQSADMIGQSLTERD